VGHDGDCLARRGQVVRSAALDGDVPGLLSQLPRRGDLPRFPGQIRSSPKEPAGLGSVNGITLGGFEVTRCLVGSMLHEPGFGALSLDAGRLSGRSPRPVLLPVQCLSKSLGRTSPVACQDSQVTYPLPEL